MTILQVRCPGTEKWIDEDARFVAASAAVVKQEAMRVRCPECCARVPVDSDGRVAKHDIEVEVRR
jgi:hypothetical protein